jgi:chemotaxis signal transduction protein
MRPDAPIAPLAESLRRDFDRSFGEAVRVEVTQLEDLLLIRVASVGYAVRLAEISGLFAGRKVTPLPTPFPELLGIAGFRGVAIPVYDLRRLLGHAEGGTARWLVLTAGEAKLTLAFDQFDGHLRLPSAAIVRGARADGRHAYAPEVARTDEGPRQILHLPSLVNAIVERAHHLI